ncbi:AraC family transcriptional regulator ligand-binding domain-containing protein [Thalassomonas haliotis]|uniref:AraC family transcriptional regulator ligand-binding domain-containing protein n=1 Tax=Thalassomonas haliotis TaxID=485448 RepID=A0ABY7VJU0_9GAMM|nr:AraC family transcriptional regulator ligand-binding domain-containing protein [Thalassomonas haliotis]WDE13728.1 AraC family transcriptional regulator ligand-binding domain-containing protein [Thalassomonas haliotis]
MSKKSVSAIAVLDLAHQLLALKIIVLQDIQLIAPQLRQYFTDNLLLEPAAELLQEQRLPETYLLSLWLLAEHKALQTGQAGFGLKIGGTVNHKAKGILANWISQAGTLAEAFDIFNRHIMLLNPSESWSLSRQKNNHVLSFKFLDNDYPVAAIERSMSALLAWAGYFCGSPVTVIRAEFAYACPEHCDSYHKVFGKKIIFNAESNCLVFSSEAMRLPLAHANPYLKQVIGERAKTLLHRLSAKKSLSEQINALLASDLLRYCQQQNVCEQLHMSRSTLYRKLKAEQTSFSELLDKIRKRKAQWGIENNLTVEQQCQQLCFHDSSSLYKAYRRWSISP